MRVYWINDEPVAMKEMFNLLASERGCSLRLAAERARSGMDSDKVKSKEKAMNWIVRPNEALDGKCPLEIAIDSDEGLKRAKSVIFQAEYGVCCR